MSPQIHIACCAGCARPVQTGQCSPPATGSPRGNVNMSSVRGGRCGDETSPGRQTEAFLALIALLCITSAAIGIILNSFLQQLHISTFVHCVVFLCLGLIPSSLKKTGTQVLVKAPTLADDSNVGDSTNLIDKVCHPPPNTNRHVRALVAVTAPSSMRPPRVQPRASAHRHAFVPR